MMFNIEILAVGLLQALHELRQRLLRALDQQMDVIGHQAVGVQNVAVFLAIAPQSFDIGQIVGLRCECLLALVAAHDDMIERPCSKQSRSAGHDVSRINTVLDSQFIEV